MIVRRVAMRAVEKSSFTQLARYITDTQGKEQRVGEVRFTNLSASNLQWAIEDVETTQARNVRAKGDKNYHLLISFAPGEAPSSDVLLDVETRLCLALGYGEHQRISAVHRDTDCLHIHVAINKIHPVRHTIHEPYYDKLAMGKLAEQLEREHGLQQIDHSRKRVNSEARAEDMERHSGFESLKSWIQSECLSQFLQATTWQDLHAAMHANGLELRLHGNGLVIVDVQGQGVGVKASTVARDLSKPKLEERLGPFEAGQGGGPAPRRRYETRPRAARIDTTQLFNEYKAEQALVATARAEATVALRSVFGERVEAAKRAGRFRRAAIKLMGDSRGNKRLLYALAARSVQDEIKKAIADRDFAKQRLTAEHTRRQWADWLKHRAGQGDQVALAALRARDVSKGLKGNTLEAIGEASGFTEDAVQDSVTKQGTVIYRGLAGTSIRDDGKRIEISADANGAGMAQGLRMASARYGTRLRLTGSSAFQEKAVRAAAAAGLAITFTDPALESRRVAYVDFLNRRKSNDTTDTQRPGRPDAGAGHGPSVHSNRDSAARGVAVTGGGAVRPNRPATDRKPNVAPVGSRPTSPNPNRLRNLSELRVVRITGEGVVLLPGDAHGHMGKQGTEPDNDVRRPMDRVGGGELVAPVDAIGKFVAERDATRNKGIDVPQYVRYTDRFEGDGTFAGIRTIEGKALALVSVHEAVTVIEVDEATATRLKRLKVGDPVSLSPSGISIPRKGRRR